MNEHSAEQQKATMAAISSTFWNLGQHKVDVLLGHLRKQAGARGGRGNAVDGYVVAGELLAQGLREGDDAGFRSRVCAGIWISLPAIEAILTILP